MRITQILLKSVIPLIFVTHQAQALTFAEFGTVNFSFPTYENSLSPSQSASPKLSLGAGISIGIPIFSQWEIEPSFLYSSRSFAKNTDHSSIGYYFSTFQIPLVIRYWSQGWLPNDLGLVLSTRYQTALSEIFHLILDLRLNYGLSNMDATENESLYYHELQLWFGIAYHL
jgi:hypothetical protein